MMIRRDGAGLSRKQASYLTNMKSAQVTRRRLNRMDKGTHEGSFKTACDC